MSQHDATEPTPETASPATQSEPSMSNEPSTTTDETTTIETLLDESTPVHDAQEPVPSRDSSPVEPSPTQPYSSPASPYAATYSASYAAQAMHPAAPEYKSGPAPTTSVIGLLGVLATIAVVLSRATDLDIPWGVVGPVTVVGAGVLLVVLGLAGLRGQRFRG